VETARIENALRRRAAARYLPPWLAQSIRVDDAVQPHDVAWMFAGSPDRSAGAVYCNRGSGHGAARWAVVDLRAPEFSADTRWFEHAAAALAAWRGEGG
jgi:hypothetical protein